MIHKNFKKVKKCVSFPYYSINVGQGEKYLFGLLNECGEPGWERNISPTNVQKISNSIWLDVLLFTIVFFFYLSASS